MVKNSLFFKFPGKDFLIDWYKQQSNSGLPDVNGHIHTPHSFSAFENIDEAFQIAKNEGVSVLGINDFYTTDGYEEFAGKAENYKIFPLFNIEFMVLQLHLQESGILVNDPNNPGRTYFSGKGLRFPVKMSNYSYKKVKELQKESNRQTYQMVWKLNTYLKDKNIDLQFDPEILHSRYAKNLFRERHIAKALRLAVFEKENTPRGRMELLSKIFSGKEVKSGLGDNAGLENEIRGNLLKAGGPAFVSEDPKAFFTMEEVISIITDAGGIPCYPVLLDNTQGEFTHYEGDKEYLLSELRKNDIYALELIPGRNDFRILKEFVNFFYKRGFVITFGTEHNTPKLDPLKISCRGGEPLDEELKKINYEGAAIIAAHQYLTAIGEEGYLKSIKAGLKEKEYFAELGKAVIAWFCKS